MKTDMIPTVAHEVIESGRTTIKNVIAICHGSTERVFGACDGAWELGADVLARDPGLISQDLKSGLVAAENEITGIASTVTTGAANGANRTVDFVAKTARSAVSEFETVFDLRVIQSLGRLGMPAAQVIRELAERVAYLSAELARVVASTNATGSARVHAGATLLTKQQMIAHASRKAAAHRSNGKRKVAA